MVKPSAPVSHRALARTGSSPSWWAVMSRIFIRVPRASPAKSFSRSKIRSDGETVGSGVTPGTGKDRIIALMVGRDVADLYPRSPRQPGEVILEVKNPI